MTAVRIRPLLTQSETRIEKAGFRSVIFPTGLRIATLLIVRRIEYTIFVYFLETRRRLIQVSEFVVWPLL